MKNNLKTIKNNRIKIFRFKNNKNNSQLLNQNKSTNNFNI